VLESVMAAWEWRWLVMEGVEYAVQRAGDLRLVGERIAASNSMVPGLHALEPPPVAELPDRLYFPDPLRFEQRETSRRAFGRLEHASVVEAVRRGRVGGYVIHAIEVEDLVGLGLAVRPLAFELVGLRANADDILRHATKIRVDERGEDTIALCYDLRLQEAFNLDDTGNLSDVGRLLYETKPQPEVEADLLTRLADPDPDVRINVLTLLGMPAYKVGFVPGAELPPRDERLEPATLQSSTVEAVLSLARVEEDAGVLSNIVCTLKSQTYHGRLEGVRAQVRDVVRWEIMPKLTEQSTLKDCAVILADLTQ
jgi:hypothetical protein